MILWTLGGDADPRSPLTRGEVVCQLEKRRCDYVLTVTQAGAIVSTDTHTSLTAAREKAGALRAVFMDAIATSSLK